MPPFITLEEHFFSKAILDSNDAKYAEQLKHIPGLSDKLKDLGPTRLQYMDAGKISLQVISHGPGAMTADQCRSANEQLAEALSANPKRFAGFAVLPVSDPDACSKELAYCVEELGFVGALIDNHAAGKHYDGPEYNSFWYTVQALGVPVYLHPTWPTDEMRDIMYAGNIPDAASASLGSSGFGWHSDVALHVLKLFAAGIFDKFPRLKIIIGHMGEMLPFMLSRIIQLSPRWGKRNRPFKEVYENNIWITTSGVWSVDPMACILRNTKIDHILYSVDYPFAKNEDGLKFMEELEKSGLVTEEQFAKIAYLNAERLLGIRMFQDEETSKEYDPQVQ